MPSTPWKLFTGLFVSLFFIPGPADACGWDPSWDTGFYRFLEPEMSGLDEYRPFYFDWDQLYDNSMAGPMSRRGANLEAWDHFFSGKFNEEVISEVVYTYKSKDIEDALAGKDLDEVCAGNPLMAEIREGGYKDFANYILLAKACEAYNYSDNYWEDLEKLPNSDDPLVGQLKAGYQSTSNASLKWRYAFQVVRLLHYAGFWNEAVQAYKELARPLSPDSNELMYYWTLSQYAGVLHGLGQYVESFYHFSVVFDKCPSLRTPAWYSFDIRNETQWDAVEKMCKSDDERANLYFMRAIVPDAVTAEEIRTIQNIAPGSKKIDLLLLREINKLEEKMLGYTYGGGWLNTNSDEGPSAEAKANIVNLKKLVRETQQAGTMDNPNLWNVSEAYLVYMGGDPAGARKILSGLPTEGIDGARARLLDLSIKIGSLTRVKSEEENDILKDFYNLRDLLPKDQVEELILYRDMTFSRVYDSQGEPGKAILAKNSVSDVIYNPELETLNDLMAFQAKKGKTLYEKELLKRLESAYTRNDLLEMKATALFSKNMLEESIKIFEGLPKSFTEENRFFKIGPDPFASNMRDIINCEPGCVENKYTKLTLAKTMLSLQKKAMEEPEKAGKYYHLLGNAYFNLSYYGACWKGISYYRGYVWNDEESGKDPQLALAQRFYDKSMKAARSTEIAALSCMMAAKCDVVETFSVIPDGYDYYDRMISNYSGTDVYQKAIRECKYFTFYTQR